MGLCSRCLDEIIPRLTPYDIILLASLREITVSQMGLTRGELVAKHKNDLTAFNVGTALNRLRLIGFVGDLKVGRGTRHYLTPDGLAALQRLDSQ